MSGDRDLEQRAAIYDGFALLFSEPLDVETIRSCREQRRLPVPGDFDRAAWAREAYARAVNIIAGPADADAATALLNQDFGALFLGVHGPRRVVSACRSDWIEAGGDSEAEITAWLTGNGLALAAEFVEPADHVAILLAAAASLLDGTAARADVTGASPPGVGLRHGAARVENDAGGGDDAATHSVGAKAAPGGDDDLADFLDRHLLSWIPGFAARLAEVDITGCYAAFAALLLGFLLRERARLAHADAAPLAASIA